MSIPLPPANTVANIVGELIGQKITTKPAAAGRIDPRLQAIAAYRDVDQKLVAIASCDMAVGASFAAALTMIPAARVDECVKAKTLDKLLAENLHEVFNVLAAAFPMAGAPRVILRDVTHGGDAAADVAALLAKPAKRVDLELAVSGYRAGKFAILAS